MALPKDLKNKPVSRSNFLRQRILVVALLTFALLVYIFAWSPLLTVRSIQFQGIPTQVNQARIAQRSGILIGEKLARIEPRSVEESLQSLDWIESVQVSRNWWNGGVALTIKAREAVGVFQGRAIASDGKVFTYPGRIPSDLPQVSAPTSQLGLQAIALFRKLPSDLAVNMSSLSAWNESSIISTHRLSADRLLRIMWGDASDIALKVKVLQALLALPENGSIKRVDLSAPHAPIVK